MRAIVIVALLTAAFSAIAVLALITPWALAALLPAAIFGWILHVLVLARYRFSDSGGQYQRRIHGLLTSRARGTTILDIGCGNGHLAIEIAKEDSNRQVTGLDYWGSAWEYSQQVCEQNAEIEGVASRTTFVPGSATDLPFPAGSFDCVVSCLTFHEVRDVADRTECLGEALRVLRPGGTFVFLDLFADRSHYPEPGLISQRLQQAGASQFTDVPLTSLLPLPYPLKGKRLLKYASVVTGIKAV